MRYYNVYYYCNIVSNIIEHQTEEYLTKLAEFSHPFMEEVPMNFSKESALIQFCRWSVRGIMEEDMEEELQELKKTIENFGKDNKKMLRNAFWSDGTYFSFEIERAIEHYFNEKTRFFDWLIEYDKDYLLEDAFEEYLFGLWTGGKYEDAVIRIADEMFYILFQNREFLLKFNHYMSCTHKYKFSHVYIPQWVKRAVFFRDRGRCVFCKNDLSGEWGIVEENSLQYDHIVSLEQGGMNDISNIQLVCGKCNKKKGDRCYTDNIYQNWFIINEDN